MARLMEPVITESKVVANNGSADDRSDLRKHLQQDEVITSIVVPVYNEEKAIRGVIGRIHEVLSKSNEQYEIIVVDDGSTDRTAEILSKIEEITYVRHPQNQGYGAALKTGIRAAKGDWILITDGDGTYPIGAMLELIKYSSECDMVVGARAKDDHNIPVIRKPVKWFLGKLANYLSETQIPDLNSGLRIFRKDAALRFYKLLPSGFSFTTTITLAMLCNSYNVKYIPIAYGKREGRSKIRPFHDTVTFIQLILRTIMYFNPLKIFLPMAAILFVGFFASAMIDVFVLHNFTDKTVMLLLAFLQVVVMGLLADLIEKRSSQSPPLPPVQRRER